MDVSVAVSLESSMMIVWWHELWDVTNLRVRVNLNMLSEVFL